MGSTMLRPFLFGCFLLSVVLAEALGRTVLAQPDATLSDMAGTFWRLAKIDGISEGEDNAVVRITEGSIDFSHPCFYSSYPFHYDLGTFGVSPSWNSEEKCAGRNRPLSGSLEKELRRTRHFQSSGTTLTFLDDRDQSLISLIRLQPTGPENRKWRIASYFDGGHLVPADSFGSIMPFVTFFGGYLDGSPGCGGFLGAYSLSGDRLKAGATWLLAGWCSGDLKKRFRQNDLITKSLNGDRHVALEGDRVVLRDDQGNLQLVLAPW